MLEIQKTSSYITTDTHLEVVCDQARYARRIGIDLEFIRERTYFSKLALVQIAVGDEYLLIDPLGPVDLTPLDSLMTDPRVCKVLHAPSQDLEIFYNRIGRAPANIFDTQMAAAMIGMGHQVAYSTLVLKTLDVRLHHSEGFTNWLRRPLSSAQEAYALDDVRHLFALQEVLTEKLSAMGRLGWFQEECGRYDEEKRYVHDSGRLYRLVKSRSKLDARGLAILRELALWREEEAQRRDKPRRTTMLDEVIVDIARRAPRNRATLSQVRELRLSKNSEAMDQILEAVQRGLAIPDEECPVPKRGSRLSMEGGLAIDVLKTALKVRCHQQNISSAMVANAESIERLVRNYLSDHFESDRHPVLKGWRGEMVGEILMDILKGNRGVHLNPDSLLPGFHAVDGVKNEH